MCLSSSVCHAQTSCPADYNLTKINDPQPSQTATHLDVHFTCIYNDFATMGLTYPFVPAPFVRVEPGDSIAVYSTPPDIYDIINHDDGTTVSLAHNTITQEPGQTFLVITWPAQQLERLSVGTINGTVLLAEGFTNLKEFNATGRLGGVDAILSTQGTIKLRLIGENQVGKRFNASENTLLDVYIETGEGDVTITAAAPNSITGEVHAVRNSRRTGSVSLVGVESITSTGQGSGMLFSDDCSKVDGNCNPLTDTLPNPDPACRLTNTCLVTAFTTTQPGRTCSGQFPPQGVITCVGGNPVNPPSSASDTTTRLAVNVSILLFFLIQSLVYY
ncbi:hypothetical protein IV203_003708 [Nitzschia inconspicua]|uniref:Uncharacterized protein n=1 Tax=Nitzschia inconspicua TaxID=303405 RepID=A0A9K3L2U8_9STRA|nr:hypothetical protein IV203_003708 [Nitzschia inconspicua]